MKTLEREMASYMRVVKPLFDQVTGVPIQAILRGELEIDLDPTPEVMLEYTKPLQENRLTKLKLTLSK